MIKLCDNMYLKQYLNIIFAFSISIFMENIYEHVKEFDYIIWKTCNIKYRYLQP